MDRQRWFNVRLLTDRPLNMWMSANMLMALLSGPLFREERTACVETVTSLSFLAMCALIAGFSWQYLIGLRFSSHPLMDSFVTMVLGGAILGAILGVCIAMIHRLLQTVWRQKAVDKDQLLD